MRKRPQQWSVEVPPKQCPAPQATLVSFWMADREMKTLQHPPYSPDLALCVFFLFPRIKHSLREIRFQSTKELKKGIGMLPERTIEEGSEEVFQDWKQRMKKCVDVRNNYFEGDKVL